jgi:hypothetical protein
MYVVSEMKNIWVVVLRLIKATTSYTLTARTPGLNKLRLFLFRLEHHVCLTCMHLYRENPTFKMKLLSLLTPASYAIDKDCNPLSIT